MQQMILSTVLRSLAARGNRRAYRQRTRAARQSGGYANAYFGLPRRLYDEHDKYVCIGCFGQ